MVYVIRILKFYRALEIDMKFQPSHAGVRVRVRVSSISQNRTIDTKKPRSEGVQHVFSVIRILK